VIESDGGEAAALERQAVAERDERGCHDAAGQPEAAA
jgi:hypothetical protein